MQTMTNSIEIPQWLVANDMDVTSPATHIVSSGTYRKELQEKQFNILFETILGKLSKGINLKECLRDDQRDFDYTQLLRWIHKDPQRKSRYYEAQEIGSEMIAAEILEIADAVDNMEDVQRSKLRMEARQFLLKTWNRKRYGDVKTLEVNQSISINAALEMAQARLVNGITIDHEDIDV